jgi:hypothetical protein
MNVEKLIAMCVTTVAVVLAPGAGALAASGAKVAVRIEGAKTTLLGPTTVRTHGGSITRAGTPKGTCPATSAAGALDVATHHKWGGTYDKSFGLEITSILGEKHTFSSGAFWEIFLNNKQAQVGACGLTLHDGDQLVYAASSTKKLEHLIAIKSPTSATAGKPFNVKVQWLNAKGVGKPLAKAHVSIGSESVLTNSRGIVSVKVANPGTVVLHAQRKGYIRAAPVSVRVSS